MKLASFSVAIAFAVVAAFLMGRWNAGGLAANQVRVQQQDVQAPSVRPLPKRVPRNFKEDASMKTLAGCKPIAVEKAALLSSEERMKLLSDGTIVYNSANQSAVLCGVIAALTKEEIREAANLLGAIQDRGNGITQEVWDSLYLQWGKVDPLACLSHFGKDAVAKSPADARHVMAGWFETDPDAALAWAAEPKQAPLEAAAAAFAITSSCDGDTKQLESAILALPADALTTKACLENYFDLTSLAGEDQTIPAIYDELAPSLKAAAWPVVFQRLTYADPQEAATWLELHAGDPGRDYKATTRLIYQLASEDPAGVTAWAAKFPDSPDGHPAHIAVTRWAERDPSAAKAWLRAQPGTSQWISPFLKQLAAEDATQ